MSVSRHARRLHERQDAVKRLELTRTRGKTRHKHQSVRLGRRCTRCSACLESKDKVQSTIEHQT